MKQDFCTEPELFLALNPALLGRSDKKDFGIFGSTFI
jgi:hypothetical protein